MNYEADEVIAYNEEVYQVVGEYFPTNRVFPGWAGDVEDGDEYIEEFAAEAVNEQDEEFLVIRQAKVVKGDDIAFDDMYRISDVVDVINK